MEENKKNERTTFTQAAPFGYCPTCGSPIGWGNSQDLGDDDEEAFQLDSYSCQYCGCEIDVYHPKEEEKKNYPFWKEENK